MRIKAARFWCGLLASLVGCVVQAQVTFFSDLPTLQQVLGTSSSFDDFGTYPLGQIALGTQLGDLVYGFSPSSTLPMIAPDGNGKQLLGGAPYRVFVGGDQVVLTNSNPAGPLTAFGIDFSYAPAAATIPANTYTVTLLDGPAAGFTLGNSPLPASGGSFFLGFVADPGIQFTTVLLSAHQSDPNTLVPAFQVNDLAYRVGLIPDLFYSYFQPVGQNTLFFQGGGGLPGGRFFLFSTTNLSLPLNQWSLVLTNHFDASGNFALIQAINKTDNPQMFFLLKPD